MNLYKKHRQLQMDYNEACGIIHDLRESKLDLEDKLDDCKQVITDDLGYKEMNKRLSELLL